MSILGTIRVGSTTIRASQEAAVRIADNLANVNTPGRHRKDINVTQNLTGSESRGLRYEGVLRSKDVFLLRKIMQQAGYAGHHNMTADYLDKTLAEFGKPNDGKSVSEIYTKMVTTINQLHNEPSSSVRREQVVKALDDVVSNINRISEGIQSLRTEAHEAIGENVQNANSLLEQIADLNKKISLSAGSDTDSSVLEDRRDQLTKELSEIMDVDIFINKKEQYEVSLSSSGKSILQYGFQELSYSVTGEISANFVYTPPGGTQPPGTTPINDISFNNEDLTTALKGGKLAGLISLRDQMLPAYQENLDELTLQLRDAINAVNNLGVAFPPPNQLSSQREVMPTDSFSGSGVVRIATIDQSNGQFVGYSDLNLASYTNIGSLVSAINGVSGLNATINTDNKIEITANNANNGVGIVSLTQEDSNVNSNYNFSHYFGFNDMLATNNRVVGNTSRRGLSQELSLIERFRDSPDLLTQGRLNTSASPAIGDIATSEARLDVVEQMLQSLNGKVNFNSSGTLGNQNITIDKFMGLVITNVSRNSRNEKDRYEREKDSLAIYDQYLKEEVKISEDDELATLLRFAKMIEYGAKIIQVADRMSDALLSIK